MDDISTVGSTTEEQTSSETATATGSAAKEKSDNTDSNSPVVTTAAPPTMEIKAASTIGSSSNILNETTITTTSEAIGAITNQHQQKDIYQLEALASATMKRSTTSSTDAISYINATNDDTYKPQKLFKEHDFTWHASRHLSNRLR
ncbi:uncharacterized protein LOC116803962 [Drosophila mojavensis]|uniref:uncharacterized protein LOC116803962 n=1 Tax=Drosophila mojavensis TaxID=7230 RepID=UPI001CD087AA|nr:uncharacterized protein LOC116803962 [Drosophila mojavensis]